MQNTGAFVFTLQLLQESRPPKSVLVELVSWGSDNCAFVALFHSKFSFVGTTFKWLSLYDVMSPTESASEVL